jgi:hypothetical protein
MNPLLQEFVTKTGAQFGDGLCSAEELFDKHIADEQCLDATVIGGYGLRDILAGKIHDSQIPPIIIRAFHAQYPHAGGFVDFVREHRGDTALLGIINGIKGKTFELEYLDYLNDGHLPDSASAELATSPTQEGWDIAIRDSHGHIMNDLQLKATESLSYIKDAIAHHPEIDVVVTHEVFRRLRDPEILSHVIDSGVSDAQLEQVAAEAVHDVTAEFHLIPWLAFGVIAIQSWNDCKNRAPLPGVVSRAFRRASYATASHGTAYFASLLLGGPFAGILSSILVRLGLGRFDTQNELLKYVSTCREQQQSRFSTL